MAPGPSRRSRRCRPVAQTPKPAATWTSVRALELKRRAQGLRSASTSKIRPAAECHIMCMPKTRRLSRWVSLLAIFLVSLLARCLFLRRPADIAKRPALGAASVGAAAHGVLLPRTLKCMSVRQSTWAARHARRCARLRRCLPQGPAARVLRCRSAARGSRSCGAPPAAGHPPRLASACAASTSSLRRDTTPKRAAAMRAARLRSRPPTRVGGQSLGPLQRSSWLGLKLPTGGPHPAAHTFGRPAHLGSPSGGAQARPPPCRGPLTATWSHCHMKLRLRRRTARRGSLGECRASRPGDARRGQQNRTGAR